VHDKSVAKNQSGMICSGEQTILLYPLQPEDANTIQQIIFSLEANENGTIILSPTGIRFENKIPSADFEFTLRSENEWLYREKTGYKNQLFIIGGGHCALALSSIMRSMDFYIRLYDNRPELKTMMENSAAHEKHLIDYAALDSLITSGENHYVVIMTC
jgi:xanthine dehydrogenase accessory factor